MRQTSRKAFYDLDKIKSVPILELCGTFGIEVERKGGNIWCKIRAERTASAILHPEQNTFHDFGTNETSDNIGLVSAFYSIDRKEAIQMIADAFHISPENNRAGLKKDELSLWEYNKIGLDGQMATRNFDFNPNRQSPERVTELTLRYAMPMNVLRSQNPVIYEKLLKQRALPHIESLRNEYYSELLGAYNMAKAVGNTDVFRRSAENGDFAKLIENLQASEAILVRACKGTHIQVTPGTYEPMADLEKILSEQAKQSPERPGDSAASHDLTDTEYEKIGLDGQMATKNFDFNIEKQGLAKVSELSSRYAMPMNTLRKQHPRIYEKLLKQRALPHVKELRNAYVNKLFDSYSKARVSGDMDAFNRSVQRGDFDGLIESLQAAEDVLERACNGTKLKAWPVGEYEPMADIHKILSGEIKKALGTASYFEMKALSEERNSPMKYYTVDLTGFLKSTDNLNAFSHSAFMKDGNVVVGYLEKDYAQLRPILSNIRIASKGSLSQKISQAQQKQETQRSSDSYQKRNHPPNFHKGEER